MDPSVSRPATRSNSGFSIVEIIVSVAILMAAVTGSMILFNLTNRNAQLAGQRQDELAAVSEDMAQILRVNDQFVCTSGTACGCLGGSCASASTYPGENNYIPDNYVTTKSLSDGITSICSAGFGSRVASTINQLGLPSKAQSLGVTRSATANTSGSPHLYTVTWSSSRGTQLRQVTLFPTVAAWCP